MFAHDSINNLLPKSLCNKFTFLHENHSYCTRISHNNNISIPKPRTKTHGINSITFQAGTEWNFFMNRYNQLNKYCRSKSIFTITKYFLDSYWISVNFRLLHLPNDVHNFWLMLCYLYRLSRVTTGSYYLFFIKFLNVILSLSRLIYHSFMYVLLLTSYLCMLPHSQTFKLISSFLLDIWYYFFSFCFGLYLFFFMNLIS